MEARRPRVARGACCATSRRSPASTCPRCTTSSTTAPCIRAVDAALRRRPAVVDKRTVADLADWPYPKQQLVPLVEVVHDRLNVEIFRGCTRGCRFCQAGMITRPVRERPEEQVRTMVARGPAPHRLRRGRAHVAVERRLLGHRRRRRRPRQRPGRAPAASSVSLPQPAGRRVQRGDRDRDPEGAPHRAHVRARGRLVAAAPGDQQADHSRRTSTPRSTPRTRRVGGG